MKYGLWDIYGDHYLIPFKAGKSSRLERPFVEEIRVAVLSVTGKGRGSEM